MSGQANDPTSGAFPTNILFSKVVVSSTDATDGRCLLGGAVSGLNGVSEQDTLQLTAQAYDGNGNPVAATFRWVSSNPCIASVSPSGLVTRVKNNNDLSYDSNGLANLSVQAGTSNLGGISTITAIALRPDGSDSVSGDIVVAVQAAAPRQYGAVNSQPSAASFPSIPAGSFNLIDPILVAQNYSK